MKVRKQGKPSDNTFRYHCIDSSVGPLLAVASVTTLVYLEFGKGKTKLDSIKHKLQRWRGNSFLLLPGSNKVLRETENWLKRYFDGGLNVPRLPPLETLGSPFEMAIWRTLRNIPKASTWSYQELAKKAGYPNGARAAGGACRKNPISILVPCHRVVGSSGKLTGYGGGLPIKRWLLDHERTH